ncbi:DgyrCDS7142 [Dimorphilus gyrociliatus]|uniref:non-specific serine/threonine protein kinase n=1 Tax=Dimorphilus gyrociliatus TaxID=2664684 RepID=A0A7I8VQ74_9ANNE|nr:DgyrCDS7142 [Dimorphilus gyrociliatus]
MYTLKSSIIDFSSLTDPYEKFEIIERLGEGTYGECHVVKDKTQNNLLAVKIQENVYEHLEEIEEEYRILKEFSEDENFPKFYGIFSRDEHKEIWFALELCSGGSITDIVKRNLESGQRLSEHILSYILRETIVALKKLHSANIIHRDVKGHNILLTAEGRVKLIDFGISKHLATANEKRRTSVGTPFWMAPEVIACETQLDSCYDIRADTWSLGITAIELMDGKPPLTKIGPSKALFHIPRSPPPTLLHSNLSSPKLNDFISQCLIKDMEKRPFVSELISHPFITSYDSNCVEDLIDLIEKTGRILHKAHPTTKRGKLREGKKPKYSKMNDDLAAMEHLSEEIITNVLHDRFLNKVIYTNIGDILITVNPFETLDIYDHKTSSIYESLNDQAPPHIYSIALRAYSAMCRSNENQSVIISGESGSGKTENTKFLLQHLTHLGKAPDKRLQHKILQLNPLLEAFGNAHTVLNSNSSRFGKYLELFFTAPEGKFIGARLSEYLLEKSRVVFQPKMERNFHIFYHLFDCLPNLIDGKCKFSYLNNSHKRSDIGEKLDIGLCLQTIGFNEIETKEVFKILAAILHIGNVKFESVDKQHNQGCSVSNSDVVETIESLIGINTLSNLLTQSTVVACGESIIRWHGVQEASDVRDALSKAIYGRLFSWIIRQCNSLLKPDDELVNASTIGLLDIFGFEKMDVNGLEQLYINIANEQLHYFFIQHIFAWEKMQYESEGIEPTSVSFTDNRPILDMLLSRPVGLLALLDEESRFPNATDLSLVRKWNTNIKSPYYVSHKTNSLMFNIKHYAGNVDYNVHEFLAKNRDYIPADIIIALTCSTLHLVRVLFKSSLTKTGAIDVNPNTPSSTSSQLSSPSTGSQTRTQQTATTYFRFSLMELLSKMVTGNAHFVRCIRPNPDACPKIWHQQLVLNQLRYTGALETAHIRHDGYSHRMYFNQLFHNYRILFWVFPEKNSSTCHRFLSEFDSSLWAIGKTKVFLKYSLALELEKRCELELKRLLLVQAQVRRWLCLIKFRKQIYMIRRVQKYARTWLIRRLNAVVLLQRRIRIFIQKRRLLKAKLKRFDSAVKLQRIVRLFLFRRRQLRSAIILQKYYRRFKAIKQYEERKVENGILSKPITNMKFDFIPPPPSFDPPPPPPIEAVLDYLESPDHSGGDGDDFYRAIMATKVAAKILAHKPQNDNYSTLPGLGKKYPEWDAPLQDAMLKNKQSGDFSPLANSDVCSRSDYETVSDYLLVERQTPSNSSASASMSSSPYTVLRNPHYENVPSPPPSSPSLKTTANWSELLKNVPKNTGNRYMSRFYPPTPPLVKHVSFSHFDAIYRPTRYPAEGSTDDGESATQHREDMKSEPKMKLQPHLPPPPPLPPPPTAMNRGAAVDVSDPAPLIEMRSKLKKIKREGTLRKPLKTTGEQIDFRSVLKKKA